MENLEINKIEGEQFRPDVNFNASTGICEISGESFLEETTIFYQPVINWITEYINTNKPIQFNFKLTYVNTSSSKHILHILKILKDYKDTGGKIEANWYVEEGDTDTEEDVEDYSIITGLKIRVIKGDFLN